MVEKMKYKSASAEVVLFDNSYVANTEDWAPGTILGPDGTPCGGPTSTGGSGAGKGFGPTTC